MLHLLEPFFPFQSSIHLFIHSYLSESTTKDLSYNQRENKQLPSTSPHVDGRLKYEEIQPGSPKGSFMTLLLLPYCHAALGIIPSTVTVAGLLYPARSGWGTYHGCCSKRDGVRTSVKTGSWTGHTHLQ